MLFIIITADWWRDDAIGRASDIILYISDSSPALAPLPSGLGQATYTRVPLSPSSITWYRSKGGCLATGEYRQNHGPCVNDPLKLCDPLVTHGPCLTSVVAVLRDSLSAWSKGRLFFLSFFLSVEIFLKTKSLGFLQKILQNPKNPNFTFFSFFRKIL